MTYTQFLIKRGMIGLALSLILLLPGCAGLDRVDIDVKHNQAIADFTKALMINPNDATAYNKRGNAYAAKGQYDQAIADYDKALAINPNYAERYVNRGMAYAAKGKKDQAMTDYTKALAITQ